MNAAHLRNLALLIAFGGLTLACQGDTNNGTESSSGPSTSTISTSDDSTSSGTSATTGTTDTTGTGTADTTTGVPTTGDETTTTTTTTDATTAVITGTTDPDTSDTSSGGPSCVDFEPWFHDGFDAYTVGASLSGEPFDAAGRTVATDEVTFSGPGAARMEIRPEDAGGFGQWGGIVPLPDLAAGRSVWVRLWARWPAQFEFSASPWMKFLRLHNRTSEGKNGGYNDLYVDEADSETSVLRVIKEIHDVWEVYDGTPIPRDTWERYEIQLVIDHVPVDDGGTARFRVWRDDALIFDRTDVPTITEAGGVIDGLFIFTYWNNEMPPNNVAFIDELTIAFDDTPPPETDALGNPRIGGWLPCIDP